MVRQALVALLELEPDIEVASQLNRSGFGGKVVIVTTFDRPGYLPAAMTAGAGGFLLKDAPAEVLSASASHDAIADIAGKPHLSPGTVRNHLPAAIQKLGARNRAEAVQIAQHKGGL